LFHPSLVRPNRNVTVASQLHKDDLPPFTTSSNNNLVPSYHLSPPLHFGNNTNAPQSSQAQLFPYQNNQPNSTIQLPSPRPSPVIAETNKAATLPAQLSSAGNSYTANTARPLFTMPPQKDSSVFRTLLPSTQPNRVTNTAQPAPNAQPAQHLPPPTQENDKGKNNEIQTEIAPVLPQVSRTPGEKKRLRDKATQMVMKSSTDV
jgi:hypothetical protein